MKAIIIPAVGESITEVVLAKWLKKKGDFVKRDEVIGELESEKATLDLSAEVSGIFNPTIEEGETIAIGSEVGFIDDSVSEASAGTQSAEITPTVPNAPVIPEKTFSQTFPSTPAPTFSAPTAHIPVPSDEPKITPLASKILATEGLKAQDISASDNHRIYKQDVLNALNNPNSIPANTLSTPVATGASRVERKERLSQLRKVVSKRLVEAKNTTAMLTTFNEVDMSEIMRIRKQYKDAFQKKHNVGLGFMSFFTKACALALEKFPSVNAYIDADNIIFHDFVDISIAVSAPKGLVVPVIRNAETLSMADIERKVVELATKARENKLTMEEMSGGTFTITNGGVFGSLLSTPILNIPQSAILGMHKIQERPIAVNGKVEIRPMMYVALSYDHRIIDGRESVGFLVQVKNYLENPSLLFTKQDPIQQLLEL